MRNETRSGNRGIHRAVAAAKNWLRGLDSNQDNQLQRLACYQLHYPGKGENILLHYCAAHGGKVHGPRRPIDVSAKRVRAGSLLRRRQFVSLLKPCTIWSDSMRRGVRAV